MPRNDGVWARVDIALLHDPRLLTMPATAFRLYMTCYLLAFQERREALPGYYNSKTLALLSHIHLKTAAKVLQKCIETKLLEKLPDNRIRVVGVSKNAHGNFQFLDAKEWELTNNSQGISVQKERQKERQIDQKESPPPEAASPCLPMGQAQRQIKEPTPEEVKKWQEILAKVDTPAKAIAMTCGKGNMPKSKVFEEALKVMKPEEIKSQCAWVEAYREINNITERADCAAILTNRLKATLIESGKLTA